MTVLKRRLPCRISRKGEGCCGRRKEIGSNPTLPMKRKANHWEEREALRTYKPGSVSRENRDGDHLSSPQTCIRARTGGTALPPWSSSQPGDEPGAHSPSIRPCSRWGLAAAASPQPAGRSCRPISPLPRINLAVVVAVCFCATFRLPRRTNPLRKPGGYPAPCPVEPGLSSPIRSLRSNRGGHPARSASIANLAQGFWRVKLTVRSSGTYQIAVRSSTKPGNTGSAVTVAGFSRTSTSWPGR